MQLHATDAYNSCHSCNIRAGQCNSERLKCRCREYAHSAAKEVCSDTGFWYGRMEFVEDGQLSFIS